MIAAIKSRAAHARVDIVAGRHPDNLADDNGDFQELEPIFFDHLEVYRGANALRFGSGTLGGAINGVTPTGQTARGFYARADAGSFGSYRLLLSGGIQRGPGDVWAAICTDGSHGDQSHARRNSLRFHGNAGLKLSDNATTRFYASVNNIDQEIPGALTQAQALASPKSANAGSIAGDNARDIDVFADVRNITGKKAVGDISAEIAATPASQIYYPAECRAVFGGALARF
jgi:iron complex outermembrane recepter protein